MARLDEEFVRKHLESGMVTCYMGVELTELSREELMAALIETGESLQAERRRSHESGMFAADMMKLAAGARSH